MTSKIQTREEWMRAAAEEIVACEPFARLTQAATEAEYAKVAEIIAKHAPASHGPTELCEKVQQRVGLHTVAVSGLWLRRIGDYVELLAENPATGEFVEVCREWYDGPFSHIAEPSRVQAEFTRVPFAPEGKKP